MSARSVHVVEARPVPRAGLLWLLGGLGLLVVTIVGTHLGAAPSTLALLVAGLAGILIVVRPEWGVFVLTSTFFLSYPEALQGSGRLTINNVLGLVLLAILAARVGIERRAEFLRSRPIQLFLLVGLAVLLNIAFVDHGQTAVGVAAQKASGRRELEPLTRLAYLIFLVAFIRARWQLLLLVWLVVCCVLLTVPSAIWNAVTATTTSGPLASAKAAELGRAYASFGINIAGNANRLAFVCTMAIAIIGFALPRARSRATRVVGMVAIAVLVVTVFLSASRSGLINLVALSGMLVANFRVPGRRISELVLALLVAVGISLAVVPEHHLQRITNIVGTERGEEGAGSTRARLELLGIGARMFADHPLLGVGIGDFRPMSKANYRNDRGAAMHNAYLLTLVEGGLVLFGSYVLLFWGLWREIRATRRLSRERPGPRLAWLVEATRSILVLFLIFSAFADIWHELFIYLITGWTVSVSQLYRRDTVGAAS